MTPRSAETLGEQSINREAFELDLKINENYQQYSAELLRLSLLAITGLAVVWLEIYLPETPNGSHPHRLAILLAVTFVLLASSAGAALMHRYTSADSLAFHLTALRRFRRDRPASSDHPSDFELGDRQRLRRDKLFRASNYLLRFAASALLIGIATFGLAMWTLA